MQDVFIVCVDGLKGFPEAIEAAFPKTGVRLCIVHPVRYSLNYALKVTKNRGTFPSDEALLVLFYLALRNISKSWTIPIRDWKAALTRSTIQLEDRMPQR